MNWSIDHWWLMVPALQIVVTIGYALIIRRLGRAAADARLGIAEVLHLCQRAEVLAPRPRRSRHAEALLAAALDHEAAVGRGDALDDGEAGADLSRVRL